MEERSKRNQDNDEGRGDGTLDEATVDALLEQATANRGVGSAERSGELSSPEGEPAAGAGEGSMTAKTEAPGGVHEDGGPLPAAPVDLPDFDGSSQPSVDPKRLTMLSDVNLRVKIELGRTRMLVEDVLKLGEGSVVELDKLAGDPVDVWVNDRLIARGEVLVLNDNFCVRISEVFSNDPHRISA
ncbi:MAG: flagellar motor switch protein FliN [Phycisphaerae bacterium]